jgi:hypothetical protein
MIRGGGASLSANLRTLPSGQRTVGGQAASPSNYEPLPRDRAGLEAFMRQRAVETGAPGSRPNWKEQETLLVPRSALPTLLGEKRGLIDRVRWRSVGAVVALLLIGAITFWFRRQASEASSVRAVPIDAAATSATQVPSVPRTVIATEPAGAELLLAGAVLGNTPVEVAKPEQGEETYLLRMRGFESQLVRITPQTSEAIRVTLLPLGERIPSPLPAANLP